MSIKKYLILNLFLLSNSAFCFAANAATDWQTKAQNVCQQLDTATQAYQQGNMQQAHLNAVMAYFQNYDTHMEPAARMAFPQSHIFDIEQQFSSLNKNMIDAPSAAQIDAIKQQANSLCQTILTDAKTMDAQHITSPTAGTN